MGKQRNKIEEQVLQRLIHTQAILKSRFDKFAEAMEKLNAMIPLADEARAALEEGNLDRAKSKDAELSRRLVEYSKWSKEI